MNYGSELFKGTANHYAAYRPMYPSSLIRYLVERFSLDGSQRMMDLGCGTGQLTVRFADWCSEIIGVDADEEMLQVAERIHRSLPIGNITWLKGDAEEIVAGKGESFNLVTIAKAFHWMDRSKVLEELYEVVEPGGGAAIIDNYDPQKKETEWQQRFRETVEKWYGNERRAGTTTYSHPTKSHEDVIHDSKFTYEKVELAEYVQKWTVDSIIGHHYSTSYGAKRFLGNHAEEFERNARAALLVVNPSGEFSETINVSIKLAMKVTP
ncbi:class I SAM-dependent methyltransferase [Thalassobacillus hwangdonensis]|uniref:Class I SAM-dependent methyltransferase n=1 Tax=Thalassobacillus hwangdonensis TaxID=546108 RepID=A0ABW3L713_9BACI